jgi:hypothetical protein
MFQIIIAKRLRIDSGRNDNGPNLPNTLLLLFLIRRSLAKAQKAIQIIASIMTDCLADHPHASLNGGPGWQNAWLF